MKNALALAVAALVVVGLPATAVAQPSNDDFSSATAVTEPLPFTNSVSTDDATVAEDDPNCHGSGATVWYSYTPTADGAINANTFGSDYDTTLSVYTGERGMLSQVACDDDTDGLQSSVTWQGVAGTTYHFMAGSYSGSSGGNLSFTVQEGQVSAPPPPYLDIELVIDGVGSVAPRTGVVTISGTVTCSQRSQMQVYGELRQQVGRQVISGEFSDSRYCDGETQWTATVEGSNGIFASGPAKVDAFAHACHSADSCDWDRAIADVRLRSGPS